MNHLLTHVVVGTNDPEKAVVFYDATFGALGVECNRHEHGGYYGQPPSGMFMVGTPRDGEPATHANGGTIGLNAPDQAAVDAWHAAGLANGGSCEGEPGRRDYGEQKIYAAYLRDPDGNKLGAFTINVGE
ncbi:VOC family protein [Aurantiacibacter sp. MUD11]|uniref:VOC family protein n=1 Tax=Aurantiacibacter sp. MUD11 TaxID=3003265 RepID=UPI0022AA1BD5|nr:VOC family protein [Aurantiacibacter sp. MUD11]WAT17430.1 VOC family protein [Aurantiacibacter sp. MUD11]